MSCPINDCFCNYLKISPEELEKWRLEYPIVECKICGGKEHATYGPEVKGGMEKRSLCFHCYIWTRRIEFLAEYPQNYPVIEGKLYKIGDYDKDEYFKTHPQFLGFGGAGFEITFNSGEVFVTHDLYALGVVPPAFSAQLPNNATLRSI